MTILEVSNSLQDALKTAAAEEAKLEKAKASLAPLEESAAKAHDEVNRLIAEFQKLSGAVAPVARGRRRGGISGPRKAYNISKESKLAAASKRAITRAVNKNPNLTETEKRKIGKDAEKSLAAKLGVSVK